MYNIRDISAASPLSYPPLSLRRVIFISHVAKEIAVVFEAWNVQELHGYIIVRSCVKLYFSKESFYFYTLRIVLWRNHCYTFYTSNRNPWNVCFESSRIENNLAWLSKYAWLKLSFMCFRKFVCVRTLIIKNFINILNSKQFFIYKDCKDCSFEITCNEMSYSPSFYLLFNESFFTFTPTSYMAWRFFSPFLPSLIGFNNKLYLKYIYVPGVKPCIP